MDFKSHAESDIQWLKEKKGQISTWGRDSLITNYKSSNRKVRVAILDSGINKKHDDLVGRIAGEFNAINPGSEIIDNLGHGTAVAGVIAANNNKVGMIGIKPDLDIYSVKVLGDNGKGSVESLAKGINWAIEQKVDIINISFGMPNDKPELKKAIMDAINAKIIVVASAGNNFGGKTDYPANYDKVISVNAVDSKLNITKFSSKGKVDFVAPGTDIITTTKTNSYDSVEGTSIATAFVTGIVAYILDNRETFNLPNPSYEKIYNVLKNNSIKLGDKEVYGNGFIQIK